ncbi:MAG: hypothetical protein VX370_01455 [Bacteroidota bacterium]|nr:hypothetical protein [Bacteroidota bacterium]
MQRIILSFFIIFLSLPLHATKHSHLDEYEIRYVKEDIRINPTIQYQLRNQNSWKNFVDNYPNWFVYFNEYNLKPHRAFGEPIHLKGVGNITEKLLHFLQTELFLFDVPEDLRLTYSNKNGKHQHINFNQYYQGLEVLDSRAYFKLSHSDELIVFGLDVFSDISVDINANILYSDVSEFATKNILHKIKSTSVDSELKILPIPKNGKYEYYLVYTAYVSTNIKQGPADYICYVDANNGDLLMRKNQVLYEVPVVPNTNVEAEVYPSHPYNPIITTPLVDMNVKNSVSGTNYYTNNFGDVVLPASVSNAEYRLEGLYTEVRTNGVVPSYTTTNGIPSSFSFNNHSTIQERTAYYAVNEVHDHLKQVFPTFTALDGQMETNIDESGSCNAYYNGSINFYAESTPWSGDNCNATAKIVDVVYHEYGHAINSQRYGGGMWNGGLNEGYADLWALTLTQTPVLGYGWDKNDPTIFVRRYDQDRKIYPQDLVGEVHADGEIIAGAFWDTYLNLGNMQQMIDLFKYTFDAAPDGPNGTEGVIYTDILLEVLYADDNDNNLANGTPNDVAIIQAFALHGITLLSNAIIAHNPIISSPANIGIGVNATIQLTYPWALGSAKCSYRLNNSTTWNSILMNPVGVNYQATIPAQLNGTVIAYYISLEDNFGFESGITPMAANIIPIKDANLPYFILVGYELREEEDFDFNFGFWLTSDPSDNASTGLWEIGVPIGSFSDPSDPSTIVQTDNDHTLGGNVCAFTGNASSSISGIGENDVDDGHTTLYSPIYDLNNYNNPAFSYWRWYTNSPPSGANPGADWWQVMITNDGINWNYVENNISSDINWRKFVFRVQDYVSLSSQVQLKFIASDSIRSGQYLDGGSLIEAAVDDLYMYEAQINSTSINDLNSDQEIEILYVTDVLGRIVPLSEQVNYAVLLYIYSDGSVIKKVKSEH